MFYNKIYFIFRLPLYYDSEIFIEFSGTKINFWTNYFIIIRFGE